MPKSLWELEAEVLKQLREGVDFGGRMAGVAGLTGDDVIKWVKLEESNPRRLLAVYIKDAARLTVYAAVHDDDRVEIISLSLDSMCGGGGTHA
jgi:hypothetical protein